MNHQKGHFMLTHAITADPVLEFAADVRAGLTRSGQKELLSKYLYDDVGSALFEVISVFASGLTRPTNCCSVTGPSRTRFQVPWLSRNWAVEAARRLAGF
jgi:hypothetical protein